MFQWPNNSKLQTKLIVLSISFYWVTGTHVLDAAPVVQKHK